MCAGLIFPELAHLFVHDLLVLGDQLLLVRVEVVVGLVHQLPKPHPADALYVREYRVPRLIAYVALDFGEVVFHVLFREYAHFLGVRKELRPPLRRSPAAAVSTVERDFATKPQKTFLDMIAPSVIKFFTDYFICGNTFRCVWALREYPTSTSEQTILRYLGEKDGVTPRIYTRPVIAAEEKLLTFSIVSVILYIKFAER